MIISSFNLIYQTEIIKKVRDLTSKCWVVKFFTFLKIKFSFILTSISLTWRIWIILNFWLVLENKFVILLINNIKSIYLGENRWNFYEFIQYFNHFYYFFLIYPNFSNNFYLFFPFLSGGGIFYTHPGNGFFWWWGCITPLTPYSHRALFIIKFINLSCLISF